ncbi:hypothetical protein FQR65_LT02920 [Abscondita terminalis]|nr:hypothetical protein FQR65_LT02920 [Abscondita terminalis]
MSFEIDYTSCACNQTPTSSSWGKNNLISFASSNSVRIYDPTWGSGGKIINTLYGHTKRVNSVKWISGCSYEKELVSGSSDETTVVWTLIGRNYAPFVLKGHEGNVNIVDGLYKNAEKGFAIVVSASLDSSIKLWARNQWNEEFQLAQTIDFGYGIAMSLKISFLPGTQALIMACGMDNSNIQLYVEECGSNDVIKLVTSEVLKGHENWVRGLDFAVDSKGDLILASASQDSLIRLWKFSCNPLADEVFDEYDLILKKSKIKTKTSEYVISLESILAGHEAWIYSVNWNLKNLTLLSASLDKSMIIWEFDVDAGLWLEKVRVGEVGGNTLGFYGGMFGPDGTTMLAHGYHGAFHIWNLSKDSEIWEPQVTVNGHFNEVVDLSWEPDGEFLLTVSTDQTTRIHAPWSTDNKDTTWHEIARPQVHGHDMSCIAVLSRYTFASGAEEKVVRTFKAPKNFVENFSRICGIEEELYEETHSDPKGAAVPSLGLSNKAVFENDNTNLATPKSTKEPYPEESYFKAVQLISPPTEETLLQNTLWPEIQKLYGHGYEIYALAASFDGSYLASACKSTSKEHAAILLWETSTWKQVQKLYSHTLTIAQLAFSPNSQHLLSVSRDRRWTLFTKNDDTHNFEIVATTDKKTGIHTRIIWCCAWSHDSTYFATGSRDGKTVVWRKNVDKPPESILGQYEATGDTLDLKNDSVTALAFAPSLVNGNYIIAIGFDVGEIKICQWNTKVWTTILSLDNSPMMKIKNAFRPQMNPEDRKASSRSSNKFSIFEKYEEGSVRDPGNMISKDGILNCKLVVSILETDILDSQVNTMSVTLKETLVTHHLNQKLETTLFNNKLSSEYREIKNIWTGGISTREKEKKLERT